MLNENMTKKSFEELTEGACVCVDDNGKQRQGRCSNVELGGELVKVVFCCYPAERNIVAYYQ